MLALAIALTLSVAPAAQQVEPAPSVRVEGQPVLTVKPVHGSGQPDKDAISGGEAYELLLAKAKSLRPGARLYTLDTGMSALSPEGRSSGWAAEFLTEKPGEMLMIGYANGEVDEQPFVTDAPPGRDGVPEPDAIGYDTKKLYDETLKRARGKVDPISRITASLYRSAGSGKALWLLDVYGDDDRIGTTVVFEAKTMEFSHQTK